MQIQKQSTNKLFYNKWQYKVECIIPGGYMIKRQGFASTIDWCLDNTVKSEYLTNIDKLDLSKFAFSIKHFLDKDLYIRSEGSHFNIFCRDQKLFDQLIQNLVPWIKAIYSPANDQEFKIIAQQDERICVCNQLPHNRYQYKIALKSYTDRGTRENFLYWANNVGQERIKISRSTQQWLQNLGSRWYTSPFIYVKDHNDLVMVRLFLTNSIKEVLKFIPRTHINNLDQGELVC